MNSFECVTSTSRLSAVGTEVDMVGAKSFDVSLKMIVGTFSVIGVIVSFLSFNIGRASVVSDLRTEIASNYITKEQYRNDQNQQAAVLSEMKAQIKYIYEREIERAQRGRGVHADSLVTEPD